MTIPAICWSSSGVRPQSRGASLVEVVERARQEREEEAERAREDERGEEVGGLGAGREAPRARDWSTGHQSSTPAARYVRCSRWRSAVVLERRVVGGRDVPDGVAGEPERKRDERPGQKPDGPVAAELDRPAPVGTEATRSSGIHSASATFCTRCAQRR